MYMYEDTSQPDNDTRLLTVALIRDILGNVEGRAQASDREEQGQGVLVGVAAPDGYSHPVSCTLFLTPMAGSHVLFPRDSPDMSGQPILRAWNCTNHAGKGIHKAGK